MLTATLKKKFVELADAHQKADEYQAGSYHFDGSACAVGCTIHDAKKLKLVNGISYDDHKSLANVIGVTEFVTRIMDAIFEGLPAEDRPAFTPAVLRAIQPKHDYATLQDHFSAWCMLDPKYGLATIATNPDVRAISKKIGELYARRAAGKVVEDADWDAAWQQADAAWQQADAAWQQADAAWQQAYAARQQAYAAWQQAYAARQQADAARHQAYAARQQADAARSEFWQACRDKLIELLAA